MLRSYANDFTVLIVMHMTLVEEHCKRKDLIILIMNLLPCFSCHLSPTSCFLSTGLPIKTTWEQELMGNSFGAIVLWKTTINMMPVFGAFFSNKNTF